MSRIRDLPVFLISVTPGFNLHLGAEYPVTNGFRFEILSDLRYFRVQVGWQIMTVPNAPGEGR